MRPLLMLAYIYVPRAEGLSIILTPSNSRPYIEVPVWD